MKNKTRTLESGKEYTLSQLFSDNNKIIIPDLQRDYCWGNMAWDKDAKTYKELVSGFVENLIAAFNEKQDNLTLGLIYGYESPKDHIQLCDGQQRITTLFLLLGMINRKTEDNLFQKYLISDFELNKDDKEPYLQYAIRESTLYFLSDLVCEYFLKPENTLNFKNKDKEGPVLQSGDRPNWYFAEYDLDASIQSMLAAIKIIEEKLKDINNASAFGDFIVSKLQMIYYDMGSRTQGEETFVVINTTGEPLTATENLKPILIGGIPNKETRELYSNKWEEWEKFFWLNRGQNQTADKGFGEFLNCIKGLILFHKKEESGNILPNLKTNDIINFEHIEKYQNVLIRLEKSQIDYKWFRSLYELIIQWLNQEQTNWVADYQDDNRSIERRRMVLFWFILDLLKNNEGEISNKELRALRFIWVRYNNNDRSATSTPTLVDAWLGNVHNIKWSEDEKAKYGYLCCGDYTAPIKDEEKIIWEIEDHPLNIDGRDLGNINISHIVDFDKNPTLEDLNNVWIKFNILFPSGSKDWDLDSLKTLMLFYKDSDNKAFWNRVTPYYYYNYDCSDWRRIVRSEIFIRLFNELFNANNELIINELLENKYRDFFVDFTDVVQVFTQELSHRKQLIIYAKLIPNIWELGNIAIYGGLEDVEKRIFINEERIYKAKRYYDPNRELWEEVQKDWKSILQALINI